MRRQVRTLELTEIKYVQRITRRQAVKYLRENQTENEDHAEMPITNPHTDYLTDTEDEASPEQFD